VRGGSAPRRTEALGSTANTKASPIIAAMRSTDSPRSMNPTAPASSKGGQCQRGERESPRRKGWSSSSRGSKDAVSAARCEGATPDGSGTAAIGALPRLPAPRARDESDHFGDRRPVDPPGVHPDHVRPRFDIAATDLPGQLTPSRAASARSKVVVPPEGRDTRQRHHHQSREPSERLVAKGSSVRVRASALARAAFLCLLPPPSWRPQRVCLTRPR
jgi:hypothetical protein